MEIDEFVQATLIKILDGVSGAQARENGAHINAKLYDPRNLGGNLMDAGEYGLYTRVDFDLSVIVQSQGKGGAKLTVFGIGASGEAERSLGSESRVKFSIPVRIPDGDVARADEIKEKARSANEDDSDYWNP